MEQRQPNADSSVPLTRKALRQAQLAQQQDSSSQPVTPPEFTPLDPPKIQVMTRAMLRARQVPSAQPEQVVKPELVVQSENDVQSQNVAQPELVTQVHQAATVPAQSAFDDVAVPEFDLADPRDAMCEQHAQEAAAYSHRGSQVDNTSYTTRASRRQMAPVIVLDTVPTWGETASLPTAPAALTSSVRLERAPRRRMASKVAVLASLAMATVATPVALAHSPEPEIEPTAAAEPLELVGPSTADVVASVQQFDVVPDGIAQQTSVADRVVKVAARSDIRTPLSGCDSSQNAPGENGQLDVKDLCSVKRGHTLRADAAVAFLALDEAYQARFGQEMCLTDAYRPLETQRTLKIQKGSLAATPGTSNHGWGLAIDICNTTYYAQDKWEWLNENAPRFGWAQPSWASRSYEPWHWEFTEAVANQRDR